MSGINPDQATRKKVMAFIVNHKQAHDGNSPSLDEVMAGVGLSSKSVARYHLIKLEQLGLIRMPNKKDARGIQVIGGHWTPT